MVIYGWRSGLIKAAEATQVTCQNCNEKGGVVMSRYVNYAHIFWIPFFPYGTKGASHCSNCDIVLEPKTTMDEATKEHYERFKMETRLPIWSFSGALLIVALVAWLMYSDHQKDQRTKAITEAPQVGDVFYEKSEGGFYTSFIISDMRNDSILVNYNLYEANKLSEMKKEHSYQEDTLIAHRSALLELLEEGEIVEAKRE